MEKLADQMEMLENEMIEKIADNVHTFGVSKTVGRVFGIICMRKEPMTLEQLSEAMGMSKMRMSQVVREMIELNIAEKVFVKGVRKDLIKVDSDYYQTFITLFSANWRKTISKSRLQEHNLRRQLVKLQEEALPSKEVEAQINILLEEIKKSLDYYNWISRLIEFFESGEIFKYVPKGQD
ncbi:GbsR/MarR family transcriptional regulator [Mammaliicoccus lentus]|uniref:HTH-type transcriptional regulator n=1 Tax=Mammaliicoccus lentus TaxID=42858 RepID=A0AAX3W3E2_MAMLE|nr:GbsR/MarR family transcriptional regulator [Mammaliicoccus lentus]WHI59798.1 GbsR/MarR family transcriptional regulator [Mammaliicoccus lentus]